MAISTFKFPGDGRLIRYQPGRKRIPGSITVKDFAQITELLEEILGSMDKELTALGAQDDEKPKELHIRLNESDKPFPLPIFVTWVESRDVQETRENWNHPHPALHRSGDDAFSEIYAEAVSYAHNQDLQKHFRYRDWAANELLEKRAGEKATDPKAGNTFQTCLAMVIEGRATGTLVVGFRRRPNNQLLERAQQILRQWARDDCSQPRRSELIDLLKNFELGGPHLRDSDWFRLLP